MKTYTDELTPIESSVSVYKAANWYEREVSYWAWWTVILSELQNWLELLWAAQLLIPMLAMMDWLPEGLFFLDLGHVWSLLC